jgi:hypothetical protein
MIITHKCSEVSVQASLGEHDPVIQALTTSSADHTFYVSTLPRPALVLSAQKKGAEPASLSPFGRIAVSARKINDAAQPPGSATGPELSTSHRPAVR